MAMKHRCAVCWEQQTSHEDWVRHAATTHGAREFDKFGMTDCWPEQHPERGDDKSCPGINHARRLPNYGMPVQRKPVDLGQPLTTRDGTRYTPIPLPLELGS